MNVKFDEYIVKARMFPVFIMLFPLFLALISFSSKIVSTFTIGRSLLVLLALSFVGAQFSREKGKKIEAGLWESWGGAPTAQLLRHSYTGFASMRRMRIHRVLQMMLPDIEIPTPEKEKKHPEFADQIYETCTRHIIARTRDTKRFPLIYKENINYGFLRNLLGIKPYGIIVSIISLFILLLKIGFEWVKDKQVSIELLIMAIVVLCVMMLWILWVKPERVKIAAFAYAERLFEYCETVELSTSR